MTLIGIKEHYLTTETRRYIVRTVADDKLIAAAARVEDGRSHLFGGRAVDLGSMRRAREPPLHATDFHSLVDRVAVP